MELSKRLYAVARAVTPGSRPADIGTDHAYVPIWLVEQGICPAAIASDLNPGPLEKAAAHVRKAGLSDRISLRLGSGLAAIKPEETDTVVIAGMGGDLMTRILREAPEFMESGKELVLQPQSEWHKVRRLLAEGGYRIDREWFLRDAGKYYLIIRARPGRQAFPGDMGKETFYAYGDYLIATGDQVYRTWLSEQKKKKEMLADSLRQGAPERARILQEEADEIGGLLDLRR
ncbi:MAG: SAM-dependent methyltransferase [Eubacterium sp.]|nr:SAM-dependent methyltransferase [Eubacterium sp.]